MVLIPARYAVTGKRQRFYFPTKLAADSFAEAERIRIGNFGASGGSTMAPALRDQALAAFDALRPYNTSLNEVVQDWISRKEASRRTVKFSAAAAAYRVALEKKVIRGRKVSSAYISTTRQTFVRFKELDGIILTEIDARVIAEECEGMKPTVKNTALAVLSAFFTWCIQTPRHWMTDNPAKTVPRDSTGGKEVQTFSPTDVEKLMRSCATTDIKIFHALGFFAGIRPEELARTRWEFINVDEKVIVLPPLVTKTGKRRVIEMTDTLLGWIEDVVSKEGILNGAIISSVNLRRRLRDLRKVAGVKWIQDGMRHTYASNWLAIHKDEHRLRDNLGHRSASELWDHYHKATTEKEAGKFWAILPSANKVVAFDRKTAA